MLFLFGRSIPKDISRYFNERAKHDGHKIIFASMDEFSSTETFAQPAEKYREHIKNSPIILLQSIAETGKFKAADNYMSLLMAADTLKRYNSGPLWAIVPFGPYARQDQEREGKMDSVGCDLAGRHLALDFEGISTVEIHSLKAQTLLENRLGKGNVFSIDPTDIFVNDLKNFSLQSPVVVSPDKGANARADSLAEKLNASRFYIDKERQEIVNTKIIDARGDVAGADAVIVDDMADTFGTSEKAARLVKKEGASRVFFYAAHPIMSGNAWARVAKLIDEGIVDGVRFANTIARDAELDDFEQQYGFDIADKVKLLDTAELLYQHMVSEIIPHPAMQMEGLSNG